MKRIFILTILSLICTLAFCQPPLRFTQFYYPNPNFNAESYGVVETSYGYMVSGISVDTINEPSGYWAYTIIGIDSLGTLLWQKKYGNSNFSVGSGMNTCDWLKKINDYYYSTFNVKDSLGFWYSVLFKFNEQGDTIWTKAYMGDSIDTVFCTLNVSSTADNGYILTGSTWNDGGGDDKTFLLKTDSLGNKEWVKKFTFSTQLETGASVIQDSNTKGYVFVGYKCLATPPFTPQAFACITDSAGVILHLKYFNSPTGGILANIKQSSGYFIACGQSNTGNSIGGWDMCRSFIVKFDIDGNLIWSKQFGSESLGNNFHGLEILSGDTLIVAGVYDTLYTQGMGLNPQYQIFKIAPNSDSLWSRSFNNIPINGTDGKYEIFKGLTLTKDGGFAMTGECVYGTPNPFVLVKLDQYGCDSLNCQTAGIMVIKKNKIDFLLYPNPANDNISFLYKSDKDLMVNIEIRDIIGRLVDKFELKSNSQKDYSTNKLNGSMFFVNVIIEGAITTQQKIVLIK